MSDQVSLICQELDWTNTDLLHEFTRWKIRKQFLTETVEKSWNLLPKQT